MSKNSLDNKCHAVKGLWVVAHKSQQAVPKINVAQLVGVNFSFQGLLCGGHIEQLTIC